MLNQRANAALHVQNYGPQAKIAGVEVVDLRRFHDDGGSMTELGRLTQGMHRDLNGFEVRQVNFSQVEPGAINAFQSPFDSQAYESTQKALQQSSLILLTHAHLDHIEGITRSPDAVTLVPKMFFTEEHDAGCIHRRRHDG